MDRIEYFKLYGVLEVVHVSFYPSYALAKHRAAKQNTGCNLNCSQWLIPTISGRNKSVVKNRTRTAKREATCSQLERKVDRSD